MKAVLVAEVERFRSVVARQFGLQFDDSKIGFLGELLQRRVEANGGGPESYLFRLEGTEEFVKEERRDLVSELTVGETYFFRHRDQLRAFEDVALPDRMRTRSASRPLRILSAGCASGEEAYSLAILIRDRDPDANPQSVSILGVDINAAALEKAARARYSGWSLRETPPETQRRWFREEGRDHVLDESVRSMVRFEERNLAEDDASLWRTGSFDIIFCRNVTMYFTVSHARALVSRIGRALAPDGYLFLGSAETLRGLSQDFHLCHTHETFYYQRKSVADLARSDVGPLPRPETPSRSAAPIVAALETSDSWIEAIGLAAKSIENLTRPGPSSGREAATAGSPVARQTWSLNLAMDLLRNERFAEALEWVGALPPESTRDPDVLLLRAVLQTHGGLLAEARKSCADLLALDELSAGAQYLLALCCEEAGDRQGAIDHDQASAYLDPGFAMPRLHAGLLARRSGDHETARRELGQAFVLLQREEASKVLLFGGGFSREGLVALCRDQLVSSGGLP